MRSVVYDRHGDPAQVLRLDAAPELFDIAASYDLSDYQAPVAEVSRPGKVGTVLLTSPFVPAKGGV